MQIAFSGAAGTGINTLGVILGGYLSHLGYRVMGDREYASTVKGDNNLFLLAFDRDHAPALSRSIDVFLSIDTFGVTKNEAVYGLSKTFVMDKTLPYKRKNMYLLGQSITLLGLNLSEFEHFLAKTALWAINDENLSALRAGAVSIDEACYDGGSYQSTSREFVGGNEVLVRGALASGMNFYSAYPMTPASTLIDEVVKHPEITFIQGEDEIAVAMAMLGAKFAGARAMCGTSGGGFALMSESLSYSHQAEIGGVYVLSQRAGPSTGTPTFQEQSDLLYALNASFGDTKPIVLSPSTYERGYTLIGEALNISDTLQHPVIVLVDKQFSESMLSLDAESLEPAPIFRGKFEEHPDEKFARYSLAETDGISPYTIPGLANGEFIATSYEHDEYGATSEKPEMKEAMTEKRFRKLSEIENYCEKYTQKGYYTINPDAKKMFILYGYNAYLMERLCKDHPEYGAIVIERLSPFPAQLKEYLIDRSKDLTELIFIDGNMSGQLEYYIRAECELTRYYRDEQLRNERNYHLYPWFVEDLIGS